MKVKQQKSLSKKQKALLDGWFNEKQFYYISQLDYQQQAQLFSLGEYPNIYGDVENYLWHLAFKVGPKDKKGDDTKQ